MMLHRHFESEKANAGMTRMADLNKDKEREYVSEIFPPIEEEEKPKRTRRTKASESADK